MYQVDVSVGVCRNKKKRKKTTTTTTTTTIRPLFHDTVFGKKKTKQNKTKQIILKISDTGTQVLGNTGTYLYMF